MDKKNPFAGLGSAVEAAPGVDQQLFTPPSAPTPTEPTAPSPQPETSFQGNKETRKEGNKPGRKEPSQQVAVQRPGAALFDLSTQPYKKATFVFTEDELEALEDLKIDLRRESAIETTKYDLVRAGLHNLIEDYRLRRNDSFIVRRLRKTSR